MDESPSEAMNFMNGENINKNSIILEALPSDMKVESSDPHTYDKDSKKDKKTCPRQDFVKEHLLPKLEKLRCSDLEIRRAMLAGITMEHNIKKLEKVNSGLPVEKETLCSAKSKDAFNLKGLTESLPSTSERKPSNSESIRKFRRNLESTPYLKRQNFGRLDGIRCSLSSYSSELGRRLDANPLTKLETSPRNCGLLEKNNTENTPEAFFQHLLRKSQRSSWSVLRSEIALDEQKKTNEDRENAVMEKAVQNSDNQGLHPNLNLPKIYDFTLPYSAITEIPPGDKLNEKSTDVENNLQNVEFPPLLLPSWDSEKKWNTDFQTPQLRVPLNSPVKCIADKHLSINKMMTEREYNKFRKRREDSKLQTLNSHRGVLSGDMDGSECENTSSKEGLRTSRSSIKDIRREIRKLRSALNSTREPTEEYELFKQLVRVCKKLSSENKSYLRSHFSSSNTYPDKVLPD